MTGRFQNRSMQKHITGAVSEFDEAESLPGVEPFDGRVYGRTA
jgi:hypothetical protein